jgi:glycosyltransferase involved in cell wall biosynthesis
VYLGADTLGPADNEVQKGPPFCLMVGNLTPNKNLETVVAAFAELKARGLNYRLIIAGSDLFGRLAATLREMRVPPNIELMQHVDDVTLATLYSSAFCLIQASHYEGFGLPIVEAMHQGCPVIASDISVLREIAGNAALFFSPSSSTALAEAVEKLTYDKALRLHLAKAGGMHASRFHWDDTARETAELFDAVLGL